MRSSSTHQVLAAVTTATVLALTGCSLVGSGDDGADSDKKVTLVTHESFGLPEELIAEFEKDTGYDLEIAKLDDAGALTNELVLTKDKPVGDVVFGIDNTFATRAVDEGVFAPYAPQLPEGAADYALDGKGADVLTPVDTGNVCVNVDDAWFAAKKLPAPRTLEDLTKPAYRDLFVLPGASTSSPGLAFLLATIARYGDDWADYWTRLVDNGAKVVKGWSDAYFTDFTFSGGDRPIVVSYDSSPVFTLDEAGKRSTTSALLDGCYRQVEYAGVLDGEGTNTAGARAVIDWLVSDEVQAAMTQMYVFPVSTQVDLPAEWAEFAVRPERTEQLDPDEVTANRSAWLEEWTEIISR
ncbi:thiamine ABC transporter substrate-binding protein [Nocardioides sp. zg-536]|uniref:Thiamine ABC transporter substrate-binding protein n=1 Tax=Nocardioides faecalis TaxID=2803858 RepID=A0A939BZ71_9ACTN|nr:thiamine ABC transporter substrate-binding protein [Nocardioides faecalis]MBM9461023.1 thiamine ABC transporter substrate-binding protein [Nocardioides faecalis]MBS4752071.1 thiamine ABC transporter substrate-binding protein [Nocardioides faecalis]QVI59114.1 thiamine ABC transporter substrate-binding protein [Nocardioides faecalis]